MSFFLFGGFLLPDRLLFGIQPFPQLAHNTADLAMIVDAQCLRQKVGSTSITPEEYKSIPRTLFHEEEGRKGRSDISFWYA